MLVVFAGYRGHSPVIAGMLAEYVAALRVEKRHIQRQRVG